MSIEYHKPEDMRTLLELVKKKSGHATFLAGGTDLMVNRFQGNAAPTCMIDLSSIEELTKIQSSEAYVRIGSMVTLDEICAASEQMRGLPGIPEAASAIASPVIRMNATLGGNLLCENRCSFYNQSAWWRTSAGRCLKCEGDICLATGGDKNCFSRFVSDMAVALIAYRAELVISEEGIERMLPVAQLYTGTGLAPRTLPENALITAIIIRKEKGVKGCFLKLRPRKAVDFSSLSTMVVLSSRGTVRAVAGGIDPGPVSAEGDIRQGPEEIARMLLKKARTVDNDHFSRTYRRKMLPEFIRKSFREAVA